MTDAHKEQAREIVDKYRLPNGQVAADLMRDIASALSSRDAEVRELLEKLSYQARCWCPEAERFDGNPPRHHEHCERAQTLYAKLQPK